jgi:hypothetical protein
MDIQKRLALVSSITGLVIAALDFWKRIPASILHVPSVPLRIILLLPIAIVATLWLRNLIRQPSRLLRPELLPTDVRTEDQLIGRKEDLPRLVALCRQYREVHLVGESGVGKSSLLRVGLYNALLRDDLFHPIYIDSWGDDWEQGPRSALTVALWLSLTVEARGRLALTTRPTSRQVVTLLRRVKQELGRAPLIIFDQFDDYLVRHRSQLLSLQHRTWLTADQLVSVNPFWRDIARLLDQDIAHVVFVTRLGEAAGLNTVRFGPPEVYPLERLDAAFIRPLLAKLTDDKLASNPERGWTSLQDRLIVDLAERGWILPVQMRVVLQGLSTLPELTVRAYNRVGAGRGIEAALIEKHLAAAARISGLEVRRLLTFLLTMIDSRRDEPRLVLIHAPEPQPPNEQDGDTAALLKAITYLLDQNVLEKKVDPATGHEFISLYHPYLCQGVREAERRSNRWLAYLRDHFDAYKRSRGNLWRQWCCLLSPTAQLMLWCQRALRRVSFDEARQYALLSTLRFIPVLFLPFAFLALADYGATFPGTQTGRDWIDSYHISVFRPYHPIKEIQAKAQKMRSDLLGFVLHRRDADGWIRSQAKPGGHDYWTQAQALCLSMDIPESVNLERPMLARSYAALFSVTGRVVTNGTYYGWMPDVGAGYTRSEPVLWAECALALASEAAWLRQAAPNLREWLAYSDASLRAYSPAVTGTGGWDIFPNQIDPHENGVYISGLALFMLTHKHAAAGSLPGMWTDGDKRLAIQTEQWLIGQYVKSPAQSVPPGFPGWRDGTGRQPVSPALTLWLYAVLLQAEEEFGMTLPGEMLTNIRTHLENGLVSIGTTDSTKTRYKISFRNQAGVYSNDERITEFPAFPWALACCAQWLRRERLHHSAGASPLVSRRLASLVMDSGDQAVRDVQDDFTFKASELIYGLGIVGRL